MNQRVLLIILALILVLPVGAYIYQFGLGFWETPSEWSNLGGYIGGIYAPILTLLTLSVLCVQIYLQVIQHRQHLVSLQEKELKEYLDELNLELDKEIENDVSLRKLLIHMLNDKNLEDLKSMDLNVIFNLNQNHHKLYSMWCGAMACLKYIEVHSKIKHYESTHYTIQKNKIIAYLGPQVCSSLDKFNYGLMLVLEELTGKNVNALEHEFWLDKTQP